MWEAIASISIPWNKYPFVRILFPFILGILSVEYWPGLSFGILGTILFATAALFVTHLLAQKNENFRILFGIGMLVTYFFIGNIWTRIRNERSWPNHFKENQTIELVSRIRYIEEKTKYWDSYCKVLLEVNPHQTTIASGNVLLRIPKSSTYMPGPGDVVQAKINLLEADHASAPYEFDWNHLLATRNIHQIAYVDTSALRVLQDAPDGWLTQFRVKTDQLIQQIFDNERDYPVASAMLIGMRKKMDPELYKAYSATGAVHVLAVSGMHVGIIVSIFEFFFGFFLSKNKRALLMKGLALLMVIWMYTLIAGATPSIMRSAMMFSLFTIGRLLQRDASALNILAGVAFVLLLVNPFDLYNIGFQLSFGAMTGIFLLYEPIRTLITPTNKVVQVLWKILSISFAAQLLIYPIVGFHFHQFAFFFWLTSLITSYLAYFILMGGMIALPIYYFKLMFLKWLAFPLIYAVKWMNNLIEWIFHLPLGRIGGWWPTLLDCILLILISIAARHFLIEKSYTTFKLFLVFITLTISVLITEEVIHQNTSEIIASYRRGHPIVWLKAGQSIYHLSGDSIVPESNYLSRYHIPPSSIIYAQPGNEYQTGENHFSNYVLHTRHEVYTWLDSREDSIPSLANNSLIILTRRWVQNLPSIYPEKIYAPSIPFLSLPSDLIERCQIIRSKNPYIEIALK